MENDIKELFAKQKQTLRLRNQTYDRYQRGNVGRREKFRGWD